MRIKGKDVTLSETKPTLVRLDDGLKEDVSILADKAGMPLSTYIRKVLRDHVDKMKALEKAAKKKKSP
jgi:predicted DNA-binding protein